MVFFPKATNQDLNDNNKIIILLKNTPKLTKDFTKKMIITYSDDEKNEVVTISPEKINSQTVIFSIQLQKSCDNKKIGLTFQILDNKQQKTRLEKGYEIIQSDCGHYFIQEKSEDVVRKRPLDISQDEPNFGKEKSKIVNNSKNNDQSEKNPFKKNKLQSFPTNNDSNFSEVGKNPKH